MHLWDLPLIVKTIFYFKFNATDIDNTEEIKNKENKNKNEDENLKGSAAKANLLNSIKSINLKETPYNLIFIKFVARGRFLYSNPTVYHI